MEFVDCGRREARLSGDTEASFAVQATAAVVARHVSAGEMEDDLRTLPESLRPLLTKLTPITNRCRSHLLRVCRSA